MARSRTAFGHVENETRAAEAAAVATAEPLPGWMTRPAPPERVSPRLIRPSDALDMPEQTSLSPLTGGADRFKRGNVVHALLARLPEIAARRAARAGDPLCRGAGLRAGQRCGAGG